MNDDCLNILYQDDRYIAVDKPSGLLVHRSPVDKSETRFCLQMLRDQIGKRVHPCHRLDKPTSGVLLFALDKDAHVQLSRIFMSHKVTKEYLAIVRGWVDPSGEINYPLVHIPDGGQTRGGGVPQEAVTRYSRLERYEIETSHGKFPTVRYCRVKLSPLTGRQHQIRRHMKHVSHPVIGDTRYGDGWHNRFFREQFGCCRLLLHAMQLTFPHPLTGEPVTIRSELPPEFDIHLPIID